MAALAASVVVVPGSTATPQTAQACSPSTTILKSPRKAAHEVQVKGINDRGDIVGFSDGKDGTFRAILWKRGKVSKAVVLGVLPGYVSSEAYGINNHRVVFGVLYDKQDRTFPFRWKKGHMTLLKGPDGRRHLTAIPDRNAINERGQIAGTQLIGGNKRAVRWGSGKRKSTLLPRLPGHSWSLAWSISPTGVVSGWSRKKPSDDGENNPVIWTKAGKVVALKTPAGRADGAAEASNSSGLTVGYTGNLGTNTDPESDQSAVWQTAASDPLLMGPAGDLDYGELVDVNESGQAAGMVGTFFGKQLFVLAEPAIWKPGLTSLQTIPVPAKIRKASKIVATQILDLNNRGTIVGNVFGFSGKDRSKLRRINPVRWNCAFGSGV